MAEHKYEPAVGDTVKLISGGPVMTVVSFTKGHPAANPNIPETFDEVYCWWFCKGRDGDELMKASFPPAALCCDGGKPDVVPLAEPKPVAEEVIADPDTEKHIGHSKHGKHK